MVKCLITPLDGEPFEIEVSGGSKGEECLQKACEVIGVVEIDYFGLQYAGAHGEVLWLNNRNCLASQVLNAAVPYKFALRVKFFIPPHYVLQETTRHQFFLQARADFESGRLSSCSPEQREQAIVAVERASSSRSARALHRRFSPASSGDGDRVECTALADCAANAGAVRAELDVSDSRPSPSCDDCLSSASLEYAALKALSQLSGYGFDWHQAVPTERLDMPVDECVTAIGSSGDSILVAVASEGIALYTAADSASPLHQIPFAVMSKVTQKFHVLIVEYRTDTGQVNGACCETRLLLGLISERACGSLYRSITERHCFYRCDTVRSVVADQYSLDLKSAFWTLLYSRSFWAKDYAFDVQHTSREAYDIARRQLFRAGAVSSTFQPPAVDVAGADCKPYSCMPCDSDIGAAAGDNRQADTCCVCLEMTATVRFTPCRHRSCCQICSHYIDRCPICRSVVDCRLLDSGCERMGLKQSSRSSNCHFYASQR